MKNKRSSKTPVAVTYDEYVRILQHTTGIHHRLGIMLAFESGLRISECIALKPEHIDLENKKIQVRGGKGDKDRVVVLPVHWCDEVHRPLLPIACSKRALQKAFELACEASGLYKEKPTVHFHSLRHGYATFSYEQGVPIPDIQMLLGHTDISTTMQYVRVNPYKSLKAGRRAWG
jgi:integrase/recombinase XerD|tara:strand:+ start:333 stop:857 length:525 start_codon:yes stop_codon:yes gene_type:complete